MATLLVKPAPDWAALEPLIRVRRDEVDEVQSLLLAHADLSATTSAERLELSWTLACATLGDRHLWQDLGLPSREALSALIAHVFPALAARNTQNMRWKKFLYRQLCEREEILICKSPSCGDCSDHGVCFGPELGAPDRLEPRATPVNASPGG